MEKEWTKVRKIDRAGKRVYPDSLRCAHCGSDNTIPIFYGYPTEDSMDALLAAVDRGEIKLGGCCVSEGMPTYHCKDCQRDSGHLIKERWLKSNAWI